MPLSASGMKGQIESEISSLVSGTDFTQGGSDECILAISQGVVDHVSAAGKCDLTVPSTGACSNTIKTPGAYTGAGVLSSGGTIYGLSKATLKSLVEANIQAALSGVDFGQGNAEACIDAICDAIVEHIQSDGKVTATTTDTGTVPPGGGPVTGNGVGTGVIDSLSASTLHGLFKSKISAAVAGADFTQGNSDNCLLGLATGIVDHVEANAVVTVNTNLSPGVTCPPPGGAGGGDAVDGAATVS